MRFLAFLLLLISSTAIAQPAFIYESSPATRTDKMSTQGLTDINGRLIVTIPALATSIAKNIDSAVGATDTGALLLSIRDDSGATKTSTAGDAQGLYTNPKGALYVDYRYGWQSSAADGLLKQVDAAWGGATDAGVQFLGVMNTDESSLIPTEGDYSPIAVASNGIIKVSVTNGGQKDGASGLIKNEDATIGNGDAGVVPLAQRLDQLATGQTGSNNEYAVSIVDTLSRLYVNPWGAAVTEFIQGCNTAVTTATTGSMLAAEASQRYYVSSWSCTNTGGAASRVILEDGAGTDFANLLLPATTGSGSITFPTPVRASAANSAMQINVITTGTSTICCFNGFKSVY